MESGHSRLLNCVAAGTLKIPVSPADAFKPTFHPSFFEKVNCGEKEMAEWLESLMRGS